MKTKILFVCVALTALNCGSTSDLLLDNTKEFNFVLRFGNVLKNEINTFNGTITKDMVVDSSITINVTFSSTEIDSIRKELKRIDIFEYPVEYHPLDIDKNGAQVFIMPHPKYFFMFQIGDRKKEIRWGDSNDSWTEEAKNLRNIFKMMIRMIANKEEVKKLPQSRGAYL